MYGVKETCHDVKPEVCQGRRPYICPNCRVYTLKQKPKNEKISVPQPR